MFLPAQAPVSKSPTSQVPAAIPPAIKQATGEAYVIEQVLNSESYEADGTGTYDSQARIHVLSQAGVQQFGLINFTYQKNFQTVDIDYVRVRKTDGTVISTPIDTAQDLESEVTRAAPFYSDLREKHIAVKSLSAGDVLEWHSVTHIFKAIAPGHFWSSYGFTRAGIVQDERYRLSVPRDMYAKVKSTEIQPEVRVEGDRRIYEWKRSQPKDQEEDLKLKYGPPFLQPRPDILISSFKTWDDVGRWYDSLQRDRVLPSPEVKARAAELTRNAKNDDEKMRALYAFVATQFRYIGVAFGIGRYQPHSAADVLDNSYGDCKDKHTLVASLLAAVGIEASPALISSTHAIDADVPSPGQFDHVITAVRGGSGLIWLDTTSEVAPFGMLTANLRDKDALLIPSNGAATLVKTPEKLPVANEDVFRIHGTLSDSGELKATFEDEVRGDGEIGLRSAFHMVAEPKWKDLVQGISYNMGYAGTVSEVTASAPEKTVEPFRFGYSYDRTDYSDWVNNKRITPPLPPIALFNLNDEYKKSGEPVRLGTPGALDYSADLTLP